jgi:hypothetical protein
MDTFWMSIAAAQSVASGVKPRGHGVLSILASVDITLTLDIGLCMLAALDR